MLRKIHLLGKPWRTFMRKAIWFLYGQRSKQKINECNNGWEIFLHWLHLLSSLPYWHKGTNSSSLWLTRKFTKRFCRTRGNDKSKCSLRFCLAEHRPMSPSLHWTNRQWLPWCIWWGSNQPWNTNLGIIISPNE